MGPARWAPNHDALTMQWVWFGPIPMRSKPALRLPLAPVPILGIASGLSLPLWEAPWETSSK